MHTHRYQIEKQCNTKTANLNFNSCDLGSVKGLTINETIYYTQPVLLAFSRISVFLLKPNSFSEIKNNESQHSKLQL